LVGQCKLCLQEKELLKKSHIVPDFMYERIFDGKHRLEIFRQKENRLWLQKPKPQTGLNEPNLLCSNCDRIKISKLENYFRQKLFSRVKEYSKTLPPPKDLECVEFSADYQKIKLFFLSILWRFSIVKKPENKPVYLGEHQETIRQMIDENNPKEIHDYPFCLYCSLNKENYDKDGLETKVLVNPLLNIKNQGLEYCVLFPGFTLVIRISSVRDDRFLSYIGDNKVLVGYSTGHKEKGIISDWFRRKVF